MASGTTGTTFNNAEVQTAQRKARELKGSMSVTEAEQAADAADKSGDKPAVDALRRALEGVAEEASSK
jgi:hypothetical protein